MELLKVLQSSKRNKYDLKCVKINTTYSYVGGLIDRGKEKNWVFRRTLNGRIEERDKKDGAFVKANL